MLIIGLTGGIATGKSTVVAMFERRGARILDFDVMARVVVEPGTPALKDIVAYFGQSVLKKDRTLDRTKVGEIVFGDAEKRKTLEGFIYPRLFEEYARRVKEIEEKHPDALVLVDTPLLFEANLEHMFEKIIVVHSTREEQIERIVERDGLGREDAFRRLEAQMPTEEKLKRADYIIHNSGSLEDVESEVDEIWETLQDLRERKANN
jgi:dephospho-CoA kinase